MVVFFPPIAMVLYFVTNNHDYRHPKARRITAGYSVAISLIVMVSVIVTDLAGIEPPDPAVSATSHEEPSDKPITAPEPALEVVQAPVTIPEQSGDKTADTQGQQVDTEPVAEPIDEFTILANEHPEYAIYRDYPMSRTNGYDDYDSLLNIEVYEASHNEAKCKQNFVMWKSNGTDASRNKWSNYFDDGLDNNFRYVYVNFKVTFVQNHKAGDNLFSLKPDMFGLVIDGQDEPSYNIYTSQNNEFKTVLNDDPDSLVGNSVTGTLIFEYWCNDDSSVYLTFGENFKYDITNDFVY